MSRKTPIKKEQLKNFLLKVFTAAEISKILIYLSNPAKYPQIIDILKNLKIEINKKKDLLTPNDFSILNNCIDDELAFALLINQNSKCDPFKFVKF